MGKYYLVDYENTGIAGLTGCSRLEEGDTLLLFFTKNASRIDMSAIADLGGGLLKLIEVPAGKQSVDMHIGSYLGYLAAENKGTDCSVTVISKDTDFDNVLKFWRERTGLKLTRMAQIRHSPPAAEAAPAAEAPAPEEPDRTAVNNKVMKLLSDAGFAPEVVGYTTSAVVKNLGVRNSKQQIYRAVISKFGQKQGLEIYNQIKKSI